MKTSFLIEEAYGDRDGLLALGLRRDRTNIYFIGPATGPIKIGKAKNVRSRLSSIQTGHPEKLLVHGIMVGPEQIESALHKRFKAHRLNGEWFSRAPEIEEFIATHTIDIAKNDEGKAKALNIESELRTRVSLLEKKLSAKSEHLFRLAEKSVAEKMNKALISTRVDSWQESLEVLRGTLATIKEVNRQISKSGLHWHCENELRKNIRNEVRRMLQVDWRTAEWYMYSSDGGEIEKEALEEIARDWIKGGEIIEEDYGGLNEA